MLLLTVVGLCALIATSNAQCNPLQGTCTAAIPGLVTSSYSIDFTQQKSNPDNWTLADYSTVNYGSNGVEFAFAKRFDAPYMWTSFYVLFGKIEVVLQAAPGQGIVSSSVMMSDDLDEIDWEWSGSNFASSDGKVQTNYFGKGILGNYERGAFTAETNPTMMFHTYTLDWTSTSLTWYIDGVAIRTLQNTGATSGVFQYPQTPSQLHLGLWNAGDPTEDPGTTEWAGGIGGYTDLTKVPYTAYVKSVKITNYNPCSSWQYPAGFSGKWQDVKCTNTTIATSTTSSSSATSTPTNLPCTYTDATGDTGYGIAAKLGISFDDLNKTNPGQNWDQLEPGITVLKVPGGNCSSVSSSMTTTSSATKSSSMTTTPSKTSSTGFSSSVITSTMTLSSSSTSSVMSSSSAPIKSPSPSSTVLSSGKSASSMATPSSAPVKSPAASSTVLSSGKNTSSMATPSSDPVKSSSTTPSSSAPSVPTSSSALAKTTNIIPTGGVASGSATSGSTITSSCSSTNGAGFSVASPATTIGMGKGIYTVVSGDYGYKIAPKVGCSNFDQLSALNPTVNWDTLLIGQTLTACGVVSGSAPTAAPISGSFSSVMGASTSNGAPTNSPSSNAPSGATAGSAPAAGAPAGGATAGGATAGGATAGGATAGGATAGGATTKNSPNGAPAPSSVQTTFNSQCTMPAGGCVYANPSATGYAPWATNCAHYAVQTLDTGCAIANKFGIDYVCTLLALNPKTNWQSLEVGQQLLIGNPVITPTAGVTSIPCPTVNPYISTTPDPASSSSASLMSSTIKPASSSMSTATTSTVSIQSTSLSIPSSSSTTVATTKASSALSTSTSQAQSTTTQSSSASVATSKVTTNSTSSAVPATTSKLATTSSLPTTTPKASTTGTMVCNHDNCLNNLLDARYSSTALPFCSQYIATPTGASAVAIPTVITNCQNNNARVSSACACLISMQPTPATPSTNKASASPSPSLWWTGTNWVNIGNLGARQLGRWGNGWKGKALGEVKGSDKADAYPSATGDGNGREEHAAVHLGKRDIHRGDGGRPRGWHAQRRGAEVEERGEGLKTGGKGMGKGDFWKWYE